MSLDIEIEELRNQINNLDMEILDKIAELIRTSRRIKLRRIRAQTLILDNIHDLAHNYSLNNIDGVERIFDVIVDLLPKTGEESL